MERFDYEDRQKRRNQPGSERFYSADRYNRFSDDDDRSWREDRYSRDRDDDYERPSRASRREYESSNRPWASSSGFGSSGYERYNGGSDRYEYRPQQDYRSLRDDSRYDMRGSQRAYNEYDQSFDPNLGERYQPRRNDWDNDRTSSYQSSGSSSGSGYGQNYGSSQSSYGSQRHGNVGSYGQNPGQGSSHFYGYNQGYGSGQGQGYSPSSGYSSQSGQFGNYNQGQQRWGSESSFQSKAGRGPKGYRRSDERIKEEISDLLTSHPEIDPSEVEIKVSNCEVTLTGTVSNRHEKRLVEDLASQISGVTDVTNQLRVQQQHDSSRSSSQEGQQYRSGQSQGSTGQTSSSQSSGSQQSSKSIQ